MTRPVGLGELVALAPSDGDGQLDGMVLIVRETLLIGHVTGE
jgi:hypothetical protein